MDHLITEALRDLLTGQCTPAVVRAIESEAAASAGASPTAAALWQQIEDSGFADLLLSEDAGGAGLALRDAFAVWDLLGQHAMPLPLAETMLARAWLAAAGVALPQGAIALAPQLAAADGGLRASGVRGARVAPWVLGQHGADVLLLPVAAAQASASIFVLDADLHWPASAVVSATRVPAPASLLVAQAGLVSALLAGSLLTVFESTLNFANERQQFGRPIGKFQAIQHELAVMAEHVSAARMAAQIACEADGVVADPLKVAVGKARSSEAAVEVAALAHSIHGAIGFTTEFDLQLHTRRLHLWRQTAGSESYWQLQAGQALLAADGMALDVIRQITDSSAPVA
ncbi:acyl-CoA/acyl-ACP dehydrogenase [Comamonas piscis]|uniref:Acyl-CoA/acyl-ACP dehydrogenase n=1 Tax=Comamonas piscis TaxID=1562974 RepID=A0A7G5EJI4_9BURK|nr:acyl-CoA dehydrogenase family protein [Comamonas piscis]QMV74159.1 acyl-CoA/acyl-ACP dehydrogenase [Comamonas piscis]WSO32599.1 acyl-CoA dehydrogenase family protein [Comamonas piscis]